MNRKEYISDIREKSVICNGRRKYEGKYFTHFVWNLYHPNDLVKKGEVVHHKNRDILDDDMDNLEKMKVSDHLSLHHSNKIVSTKTRKKLSKTVTGSSNPMYGRKFTEKTKEKMSETKSGSKNPMFGKNHTKETRKKMSKVKTGSNHPMYGRKHSEETRRKMSLTSIGKKHTEETKRKISISMLRRKKN